MAGLRGNVAWILAQKQVSKGTLATIATVSAYKMPMVGGGMAPSRTINNLQETDASRDRGISYAEVAGVAGSPEFYVRDASIGFWLWAALGADAVSGTTNFTHVLTPSTLLPYISVWRDLGDVLYESYRDCKVGTLVISAQAGQPLTATASIQGLVAARSATAPDVGTPIAIQTGPVYNFNNATVTLGGSVTALVSSFELTIENNLTSQQTDDFIPYDVYEGSREVSLTFDLLFDDISEYNKFHYGGAAGTAIASAIYTTTALFDFNLGTNNDVAFNLPSIAYTDFPADANAGGDAVTVTVAAAAQRGASPVVTATVKNQVASY
jgi:hypothetical protein